MAVAFRRSDLVAVRDVRTNAGCVLPVLAGERARDVFDHPYAYTARRGVPTTASAAATCDFGIDITIPMDGGGVVVGDKVSISLEIQAVLQK